MRLTFEYHIPIAYDKALGKQQSIFDSLVNRTSDISTILFCEHEPVLTFGKHADHNNVIHPDLLKTRGVKTYQINRGGDVTYHGPGQLVVYPIIDMNEFALGVKSYVALLQDVVIELLGLYGIEAFILEKHPGVWVYDHNGEEAKICALGVYCHKYVTMHGFALNVNTDMDYFKIIRPCGIADKGVTSMSKILGEEVDIRKVAEQIEDIFTRNLVV